MRGCRVLVGIVMAKTFMLAVVPSLRAQVPVRPYDHLPVLIRQAISVGAPRSTKDITDSPFGTHTTICAEGGSAEYVAHAADMIADAGYKWVVEYLRVPGSPSASLSQREHAISTLPGRECLDYIRTLHQHGFSILMRLDALPMPTLTGKISADEDELRLAGAFATQVATQLKPWVSHWQIGNEPNTANAPEEYVRIAAVVAHALRSAQPAATIYGPGVAMLQSLSDKPFPWIDLALRAGLLKYVDVFSFHPYRANGDMPEQASEFAQWRRWPSYYAQIADLRQRLHSASKGRDVPIAATEDGEASPFSATGEQRVTWIIDAKNELRRALQDFWLGVYPRTHFAFYRSIPDAFYSVEGSFNSITAAFEKKPLYYAAQNLHAVIDSTYIRTDDIKVDIAPREAVAPEGVAEPRIIVQTYVKDHGSFDELLIFFWAATPARDLHLHLSARLALVGSGWEAPILVDLMTMPGRAPLTGYVPSTHNSWRQLDGYHRGNSIYIESVDIRDYPQLIKFVRIHGQDKADGSASP